MKKYDFLIDYEIRNLFQWIEKEENKTHKGIFEEVYGFIKELIYNTDWTSEKKDFYMCTLKGIKKDYYRTI